jgi:aspartate aminotransferase
MYFTMIALLEPGDEVMFPDPGFPIYESMIRFLGAKPVSMPLLESKNFSLDLNMFRDRLSSKTKMVVLNSPQNPTGGIIPASDLAEMAAMLRDRDVMILSDEIYSRIWYENEPTSITANEGILDKTIILDGFSKTFSMTGWRLGYGVMPTWLAGAVTKLMVNSNSCTASFTQRAGIAALEGPQDCVDKMVAEFRRRRDAISKGLNEIPGFKCQLPAGAFYAYANVKGTGVPSNELADLLLNEAGVACLNGGAFGEQGNGYIRFSYANSLENIMDAVNRIKKLSERWAGTLAQAT